MRCLDDFFLSRYADGELAEEEALKLAAHLEACSACRKRALAFKAENELLRRSLQDIEIWESEQEPVRPAIPKIAWVGAAAAALLAIALLLRTSFDLILNTRLPSALDWIYPFSLSGKLNLIFNGLFYFLERGRNIMNTFINETGAVVLGVCAAAALIAAMRRTRRLASMVCLASMLMIFVVPGHAVEIRKADKKTANVSVAAGETVDDSLVVFADSVDVQGTVTGDLITFARRIDVRGVVEGNIITFGQNVDISGKVDGDIIGFGQTIREDGEIGKNLWAFAQNLDIDSNGTLGQNATLFGANINVDGNIGRDLTVFAAFLDVSGTVGRDLSVAGDRLTVQPSSVIGRNLNAHIKLEKNVQIDPGATIKGATNIMPPEEKTPPNKFLTFGFYFGQFLRIAGAFVMGLLLFWLVPGMKRTPLADIRGILASGGIGFLGAFITPIAALILIITLIGIPVAVAALLFWIVALYFAKIIVGGYIGSLLLRNGKDTPARTALALLIGLVLVIVAVNIPFIGGVVNFLLTVIGLGAVLITAYRLYRSTRQDEPIQDPAA